MQPIVAAPAHEKTHSGELKPMMATAWRSWTCGGETRSGRDAERPPEARTMVAAATTGIVRLWPIRVAASYAKSSAFDPDAASADEEDWEQLFANLAPRTPTLPAYKTAILERALARGMDPEERPDQAAPPGLTMRSPSRAQPHTARPGISLSKLQRSKSTKARKPPRRRNMKNMKIIIALLLGATGAAAFTTGAETAKLVANETAKLVASDAEENDNFGISVAISGDLVVVGAWGNGDAYSNSGSVYVYNTTDGGASWNQTAKLDASDAEQNARCGVSAAISGDGDAEERVFGGSQRAERETVSRELASARDARDRSSRGHRHAREREGSSD